MNVTSSTTSLFSPKYVPSGSSTESDSESSIWDMKFTDISLFAADIQWRLDPHWGFWINHLVSQTNSILTSSSPLGLGLVKSWIGHLLITIDTPPPPKVGASASSSAGSGCGSGAGKNGGVWGGFTVEGGGSVCSAIVRFVIHIVSCLF